MRRHHLLRLLLLSILLAAPPAVEATAGEARSTVLSADGKVWRIQSGRYGDLFPGSSQVDSGNLVLALDQVAPDGLGKRWLVPETASAQGEYSPGLIYEEATQAVYLIWESLFPNTYSRLLLTSLQSERWSEVIEITGNPFSRKGSPQVQVIREVVAEAAGNEATEHVTTVIQLVWWEESRDGKIKRYAPIVIRDGAYVGWTPVYDLGAFLPEPVAASTDAAEIEEILTLQRGVDSLSAVVGFFDPHSGQLGSLEIRLLPSELADLAEQIREHILALYAEQPSLTAAQLAEKARAHIIHIGAKFHTSVIQFLSEQIAQLIVGEVASLSPENVALIADKARAHIIHIGAKLKAGGLEGDGQWQLIELGQTSIGGAPYQLLKVAVVGIWEPVSADAGARLFVSESGKFALIAWQIGDKIFYRESLPDGGWTQAQQILLGQALDADAAFVMLASRVKSR